MNASNVVNEKIQAASVCMNQNIEEVQNRIKHIQLELSEQKSNNELARKLI